MSFASIVAEAFARMNKTPMPDPRLLIPVPPQDKEGYVTLRYPAELLGGYPLQYLARYTEGTLDYPDLGEGLRFEGDPSNYHDMRIHLDDVKEFVRRMTDHRTR